MPAGRPSLYNEAILAKTDTYITECLESHALPSVARLAIHLGVARRTVYDWADKHEEFLHILERVLSEQEASALEKGLNGEWNATIVKLLLGKHGYSEKHQQEVSGPDGGPIQGTVTFVPAKPKD